MLGNKYHENVLYEANTKFGPYQVVDRIYSARPSRLLYSGKLKTAQSGIALDDHQDLMLFGYNQRFMELALELKPARVLVIGGGVYTLPMAILNSFELISLDVVEPNEELDAIAAKFFNFKPDKRLNLYHNFGLDYLKTSNKKYDLIVIDAYDEDQIADEIFSAEFTHELDRSLEHNGVIAVNVISSLKPDSPLKIIQANYLKVYKHITIYDADAHQSEYYFNNNYVMVAGHSQSDFQLKYPPLSKTIDL